MTNSFEIRQIQSDDIVPAMELVWQVFAEFEAPEYASEGVEEFQSFIAPEHAAFMLQNNKLRLWGAFDGKQLIGVLGIRSPLHISLLFVDRAYHRRGVAKNLWKVALNDTRATGQTATVNSSPYAVEVYKRLGFVPTSGEQTVNGIRFIPMERCL